MSIKTRLVLSYIAMTIIPIFLSATAAILIASYSAKHYLCPCNENLIINPVGKFMKGIQESFSGVEKNVNNNPDKLADHNYLENVDKQLNEINSGIVVRKNGQIIYSSKMAKKLNVAYSLTNFNPDRTRNMGYRRIFESDMMIQKVDFYFSDKSQGSVFLITDTNKIGTVIIKTIVVIIIVILIILAATDGILTFYMSKKILTPLSYLKKSANRIKEGDLNFKIEASSKDEIGQVCMTFEEMRAKLKESIDMQNQYESNRKELISNISHDLKTPITAIKGYVEGVMDGVADTPEKMDKYIKTIYTKAADLDKLIDELFLFSKLDANKQKYEFENINVCKYLMDCFEELEFDLEKVGIQINYYNNVESPLTVMADREKIKRVIMNIVYNAVKYMDKEDGVINIRLSEMDDFAVIQIEDNGMGIPQDEIPKVFNRFYRVEPSRNAETGGSGLGLAIAQLIINDHGGSIWIESEENQGTSVFFTLKKHNNSV